MLLHDLRVYAAAADDVDDERERAVEGQKRLGQRDAAVRGVVQRALEPLDGGGVGGILRDVDDVARQRADTLRAHRVFLVRHRGGADLFGLERLVELLHVGEKPDVGGRLVAALRDVGQHVQDIGVDLARIRLARDGHTGGKAHLLRDHALERVDLLRVAAEQLEEARAGAGRALAAEKTQAPQLILEPVEIHDEILQPQAGAFAHGRRLGGLEMGVRQRGNIAVFAGEIRKRRDHVHELDADARHCLPELDDVGVVADVAARRAEVDDRPGRRADVAVGVDVRHDVVAQTALVLRRLLVVDVVDVRAHFGDLFVGDGQAQRLLRLRQRDPEPTPGGELEIGGEDALHLTRGVPGAQGVFVDGLVHDITPQ